MYLQTVANIKTTRECTASAPPSDSSGHSQEEVSIGSVTRLHHDLLMQVALLSDWMYVYVQTVRDKDKAERKRKAEMARLRREKIMAQMSEMQRHFINENKELFQQSLEELDPSTSSTLEHRYTGIPPEKIKQIKHEFPLISLFLLHSPSSCDSTLFCVGPRRWRAGGSDRRQVVTCILCQEEQEIRTDGKAMVLAAFVQRSTVMSKNRKRPPHNPGMSLYVCLWVIIAYKCTFALMNGLCLCCR